jgi:hypothetical protein
MSETLSIVTDKIVYRDAVATGFHPTNPYISHYLCTIDRFCGRISRFVNGRAASWRRATRELLELFRAAAAAKKWSRWAWG